MKFDFCIGNPPYQEEHTGGRISDKQVYPFFLDAAYEVADKVEMIHPARFLFNAGSTSKEWNKKMLSDEHLKILHYEQNSKRVFNNTSIIGGVVVTYHDKKQNFDIIGTFNKYSELSSLCEKLKNNISLSSIMYPYSTYTFSPVLFEDYPILNSKLSNKKIITTNIFDVLADLFIEKPVNDCEEYCCFLGRKDNRRCYRYILSKYVCVGENYNNWKIIVSAANGAAGIIGDNPASIIGVPIIEGPNIGYTQTFFSIGNYKEHLDAQYCLKYIKTKFVRAILGILKVTQRCTPETWKYVPLQDFTSASDIDWSKSIHEIDLQLYRKYGLDEKEIAFIEEKVKAMD